VRRLWPDRLRWRLTLAYLAILVAALAAIGAFQYFALRAAVLDEQAGGLRDQALYAVQVRGGLGRALAEPGALVIAASSADVRAALYDSSGQRITLSTQLPVASPWAEPSSSLGGSSYSILDAPGGRVLAVRVDLGESGFSLVLERSLAGTEALLRADLVSFGLTAVAVLIVAGGLGVWLAGRSLGRLESVSKTATAIAAGEHERRVGLKGDDEVARLGAAFDDMVERLEQEIKHQSESEAAMRRFLADASHELRTPLTALRGNLDVLIRGAAANPRDLGTALYDMHQTVVRMSRLVGDLLTLARLEQAGEINVEAVEIAPLVAHVARTAGHLAQKRPIGVDVPPGLAALADPDSLHQVLLNLVDNAAGYSREDRPIKLTARQDGTDRVAIEVEDRGAGIPARDLPHIFERFFRGSTSRSRQDQSGAGLGLAISAALVARQGGRIEVSSEEGVGSTFTVILPRAESLDVAGESREAQSD
jgi:two-component system OmpR family sensor kinase